MNPAFLIERKRDGGELTADEIHWLVQQFTSGELPDYQMAALAMAIYYRGMTAAETAALTEAKLTSGKRLTWSEATSCVVDKHSTGGIGDKSSLIIAPLLACCGLAVPMISGRGLGPTGGTLDKLESIPGFRTDLSTEELVRQVELIGCVITGATEEIAPADRKLYALRDVTATVPSIPLIVASIMSKKLAASPHALVMDVKFGSGAFMQTYQQALTLAESLVATGGRMGVATSALLTDMNQPTGRMVGNALEVEEALATLEGAGPSDLLKLTLALCVDAVLLAGAADDAQSAHATLEQHLHSGRARERFEQLVTAQGGNLNAPRRIAPAAEFCAAQEGFVCQINAAALGRVVIELGGGRRQIGDRLDHGVGLEMLVRIGDGVRRGQPLVRVFATGQDAERVQPKLAEAIRTSETPTDPLDLIRHRICSL